VRDETPDQPSNQLDPTDPPPGTSVDTFLRENLEWLSRATNWAKFSATAGLGVIHRGQLQQGERSGGGGGALRVYRVASAESRIQPHHYPAHTSVPQPKLTPPNHPPTPHRTPPGKALLAPYLPREGAGGSSYSEGGALYALGLIAANHGAGHRAFLLESLRAAASPVTQHGACLGLGLACLGTCDDEVFEDLKNTLYTDDAVAGEAAGLAMGLLLCGSSSDKAQEMLVGGLGVGGGLKGQSHASYTNTTRIIFNTHNLSRAVPPPLKQSNPHPPRPTPTTPPTRRSSAASPWASPSPPMAARRAPTRCLSRCPATRTPSCGGAPCTRWAWRTAAPPTTRPSRGCCTAR
jgi:hypothetical protein